ncbi:hypothetical protein Hanom_Chr09g00796871 [Helianthus anomalus]
MKCASRYPFNAYRERVADIAKHTSFTKHSNGFLNHVANGFQQTQMVYERFMLNIPVLQNTQVFHNVHEFHD